MHVAADWADIVDTPTKQENTYLKPIDCKPPLHRGVAISDTA